MLFSDEMMDLDSTDRPSTEPSTHKHILLYSFSFKPRKEVETVDLPICPAEKRLPVMDFKVGL